MALHILQFKWCYIMLLADSVLLYWYHHDFSNVAMSAIVITVLDHGSLTFIGNITFTSVDLLLPFSTFLIMLDLNSLAW